MFTVQCSYFISKSRPVWLVLSVFDVTSNVVRDAGLRIGRDHKVVPSGLATKRTMFRGHCSGSDRQHGLRCRD